MPLSADVSVAASIHPSIRYIASSLSTSTTYYDSATNLKYFQTSSLPSRVSEIVNTAGTNPTPFALATAASFYRTARATFPGLVCDFAPLMFLSAFVGTMKNLALFRRWELFVVTPTFCMILQSSSVRPWRASMRCGISRAGLWRRDVLFFLHKHFILLRLCREIEEAITGIGCVMGKVRGGVNAADKSRFYTEQALTTDMSAFGRYQRLAAEEERKRCLEASERLKKSNASGMIYWERNQLLGKDETRQRQMEAMERLKRRQSVTFK